MRGGSNFQNYDKSSCKFLHLHSKTRTEGSLKVNSLVDSVVDQQLCEDGSEEGGGDAQTEAAPGPIERPPQAQGQSCEC